MARNRHNGRSHKVTRKSHDAWAVLAVPPEKLEKRLIEKGYSLRAAAEMCGHASHSHIWRLAKGQVSTTSVHTAALLEAITDSRGLLFVIKSARTSNQVAA